MHCGLKESAVELETPAAEASSTSEAVQGRAGQFMAEPYVYR